MQLHCLGTTGYHPSETRHTACYFLPESGLVLDAGTGLFRLPSLLQTDSIDILLSHAHLDHVIGLTFLLDIVHQRPLETVRIWGEREKLKAIREHLFHHLLFPVIPELIWCPLEESTPQTHDGAKVQWFPLEQHAGGSVGYRITWENRSLAYVTDTVGDPNAQYVSMVRDVNLLLHECYFRDEHQQYARKTGHTWTTCAAEVALAAKVDQLILIHINPLANESDPIDIAKAREVFPNSVIPADLDIFSF